MKTLSSLVFISVLALAVTSCSQKPKEPSFGERIRAESAETEAIGEKWIEGEELVLKGNKLLKDGRNDIEKGEKLLSKGEKKVSKAEDMIKKGSRMKSEAEKVYQNKAEPVTVYGDY